MPAVTTDDYLLWLTLRRNRVLALGSELAEVAERQNRPLHPAELANYRALDRARIALDNKIRLVRLNHRADTGAGSVERWARQDPRCGAMAVAPGSGSHRALTDALSAARR